MPIGQTIKKFTGITALSKGLQLANEGQKKIRENLNLRYKQPENVQCFEVGVNTNTLNLEDTKTNSVPRECSQEINKMYADNKKITIKQEILNTIKSIITLIGTIGTNYTILDIIEKTIVETSGKISVINTKIIQESGFKKQEKIIIYTEEINILNNTIKILLNEKKYYEDKKNYFNNLLNSFDRFTIDDLKDILPHNAPKEQKYKLDSNFRKKVGTFLNHEVPIIKGTSRKSIYGNTDLFITYYTKINELVDLLQKYFIIKSPEFKESASGGAPSKPLKKSKESILISGKNYSVYLGPRGGKYIKKDKKYVSVRSM